MGHPLTLHQDGRFTLRSMTTRFRDLPVLAQLAIALTLLNSWILFEETVVDRTTLWQHLPQYQVGSVCIWDASAVLAIAGLILFLRLRK
jgi:hypothetical protein